MSNKNTHLRYYQQTTDMCVSCRSIDKKLNGGLHWHDFIEIELVVDGTGTHMLNGVEYAFKPGSTFILRPADYHCFIPEGTATLYNISIKENMLSREMLNSLALYNGGITAELESNELYFCQALAELMLEEYKKERPSKKVFMNLLDSYLIKILDRLQLTPISDSVIPAAINDAIAHINMHFTQNPTLKEAAELAHYNTNYFSARFKEVTGVSYSEYLCTLKLDYAKKLLVETDIKVSEVAFKSGFCSLSNFLKVFKQKCGISPLKYRKERK